MNDIDQEVVREPFECPEIEVEPLLVTRNQPRNDHSDNQKAEGNASKHQCRDQVLMSNLVNEKGSTKHYDDEESSSDESEEVIDFAKSFGIHLKSSRDVQSAYKSLLESDQFESSSTKQSSNIDHPKPVLKTSVTSDCIYHKGTFYQKGDIVALYDQDDGQVYFAQLTGFLQDQFCEKSASVNWLVPIRPTSRDFFDPSAYKIGFEDSRLTKLDCMTFVRHCPHDYYINKFFQSHATTESINKEAHTQSTHIITNRQNIERNLKKDKAFIWTTMGSCKVPTVKTIKKTSKTYP